MPTQKRKTTTKKAILKEALTRYWEKTSRKPLASVTSLKEAGVNRGTFYLHYVDKFDMMDKLIDGFYKTSWPY